MKKYRLIDSNMKGVFLGLVEGKQVILGDENSTEVDLNNRYLLSLLGKRNINLEDAIAQLVISKPRFNSNESIIKQANYGEKWPIKLGLVEEISEEPKRVYIDRYEALRMVYEQDKVVAYDDAEWLETFLCVFYGYRSDSFTSLDSCVWLALSEKYNKKLWYVVER